MKKAIVFGADILTNKGKIGSIKNSSVLLSMNFLFVGLSK
jgi:hypothetical protein